MTLCAQGPDRPAHRTARAQSRSRCRTARAAGPLEQSRGAARRAATRLPQSGRRRSESGSRVSEQVPHLPTTLLWSSAHAWADVPLRKRCLARPSLKSKKVQESSPSEPSEDAAPASEPEQAEEPDLDDDAVLAEAELVDPADFEHDEALEEAPLPALAEARGADGDASIAKYDPLQAYMREVQQHPLLNK